MNWYYANDNQRQGPISENEFDYLVHTGKIGAATLVWNEGMAEWRPWREVKPPEEPPPIPEALLQAFIREPERDGPAWEHRDRMGGIAAAVATVREFLATRNLAFARMKLDGGWFAPYCFALFTSAVGYYTTIFFNIIIARMMGPELKGPATILLTNTGAVFMLGFALVLVPALVAVTVMVYAVIIHVCLSILGEVKQPFRATYRLVCYSLGASSIMQVIPVFGFIISLIWNTMLLVSGIASLHKVSPVKAALCVVPIVLGVGFLMLLSGSMM